MCYMIYNNAPIKEAIFDIRIDKSNKSKIEDLNLICEKLSDVYPIKNKQVNFESVIKIRDNEQVDNETNSSIKGYILSNTENNCQVQIRLDGFTFNMLSPYSEWSKFSNEAFRVWEIYNTCLKPNKISRLALRYINKIDIPLPLENFQDYILNMPPIPKNLPQNFNTFFMQINIPCKEDGMNIVITETIEQPKDDKNLPFILDIDTYIVSELEKDIKSLKNDFEKLRNIKNETFENCITEETRAIFN